MSVFNALNATIYSLLSGGTALTTLLAGSTSVYYLQAPDNATFDYVVYSWQAGGDENMTANRTKNQLLFARGYSKTGPAKAGSIDAQIDALLHGKTLTVAGWANFWTAREEDLAAFETAKDESHIWMAGGTYRIRLDKN